MKLLQLLLAFPIAYAFPAADSNSTDAATYDTNANSTLCYTMNDQNKKKFYDLNDDGTKGQARSTRLLQAQDIHFDPDSPDIKQCPEDNSTLSGFCKSDHQVFEIVTSNDGTTHLALRYSNIGEYKRANGLLKSGLKECPSGSSFSLSGDRFHAWYNSSSAIANRTKQVDAMRDYFCTKSDDPEKGSIFELVQIQKPKSLQVGLEHDVTPKKFVAEYLGLSVDKFIQKCQGDIMELVEGTQIPDEIFSKLESDYVKYSGGQSQA